MNKDTSRAEMQILRGQDQKPTEVQNELFASFPLDCAIVPHAGTRLLISHIWLSLNRVFPLRWNICISYRILISSKRLKSLRATHETMHYLYPDY